MLESAPPGDPRHLRLVLNGGRPLVRCQDQLLTAKPSAWIRCLVGGLGSAKTTGGALSILDHAASNPWTPKYKRDERPQTIVFGITWGVLRDSAFAAFFGTVPEALIRRHRKADRVTELVNGHEILWRTAKGKNTGNSVTGLWVDEAHLLHGGIDQWLDMQARVRDARGTRRIVVTGVPVTGWVAEVFADDKSASDPERLTLHARTRDNPYLPANYLDQLRKSVSRKEAHAYFEGEWISPQGAAFYEWNPAQNITSMRGNRAAPCYLSLDVGRRGAVLWGQTYTKKCRRQHRNQETGAITWSTYDDTALHIVDEMLTDDSNVKATMRAVKERGWTILPKRSSIMVDPNCDGDEMEQIELAFPGVDIIKKTRGDATYAIMAGVRAVNAALCDADDNVRLTISADLPREPRSLIPMMTGYRMDQQRRAAIKDQRTDHVADALRYMVAEVLPLTDTPTLRVYPGR